MKRLVFSLSSAILLNGCATDIITSTEPTATGLRYPLPLNQLQLTVKQTTKYPKSVVFESTKVVETVDPNADLITFTEDVLKHCYSTGKSKKVNELTNLDILNISDWTNPHTISVDPHAFSSGSLTINRSNSGWLTSLNVDSDGAAVDVLKSAFSIAGTVTGFSNIKENTFPVNLKRDGNNKNLSRVDNTAAKSFLTMKSYSFVAGKTKIECTNARTALLKAYKVDGYLNDDSSKLTELAIFHGYITHSVFENAKKLKQEISKIDDKLIDLNTSLGREADLQKIAAIRAKIKTKNEALLFHTNKAKVYAASLTEAQDKVKKLYNIKPSVVKTEIVTFDIEKLEVLDISKIDNDKSDTATAVQSLGIAIELKKVKGSTAKKAAIGTSTSFIAYRDPEAFIAKFYTKEEDTWKLVKAEPMSLISSTSPVGYMEFEASNWAKRSMALTFNTKGVLTGVEYKNEPSAQGLFSAIEEGTTSYISKLKSAQELKVQINNTQRNEYLSTLQFEIDQLTKEKGIIEARTSLDLATSDSSAELQELNKKIELLEKQEELLTAQSSYELSDLTSDYKIEQQLLKAQLDSLKAQQALSSHEAGANLLSDQIANVVKLGALQQQLVDANDDNQISKIESDIKKLEIQLSVLLKELQLRGAIESNQ